MRFYVRRNLSGDPVALFRVKGAVGESWQGGDVWVVNPRAATSPMFDADIDEVPEGSLPTIMRAILDRAARRGAS